MPKLAALVLITASVGMIGCLSSQGSSPPLIADVDAGSSDSGLPVQTPDGSLPAEAGSLASLTTGLGSGIVAHSEHFTVITKTGQAPGAGFKGSAHFKLISGAAPPATAK